MQDRKPTNPGYVRLTNISGDIYQLERADDPENPGTKLNAANLLSDTTASQYYNLTSENATPNNAFAQIGSRISELSGIIEELDDRVIPIQNGGTGESNAPNAVHALMSTLELTEAPAQDYTIIVDSGSASRQTKLSSVMALFAANDDFMATLVNAIKADNDFVQGLINIIRNDSDFIYKIIKAVREALISYGTTDPGAGSRLDTGKLYVQYKA